MHTLVIANPIKDSVVKVDYTDGKVVNGGTGSDVAIDTVTIKLDSNYKNGTEFVSTTSNTFNKGIDGDESGALATNNRGGSYLLINDYALGTGDFTISTWVYVSSYEVAKGNSSQIFATSAYDKANASGKLALSIRSSNNAGVITHKINSDTSNNFSNSETQSEVPSLKLDLVGWHKYTITREGTVLKIYLDGTLVFKRTLSENFDFGTQTFCFGSYIGEKWAYNDGVLVYDNVTIYDCALSQNQITALTALKK